MLSTNGITSIKQEFLICSWFVHSNSSRIFSLNLCKYFQELRHYTESDVDILLRCLILFNDLFHSETGIHPLLSDVTIAQTCMRVYRTNFLQKDSIGVIPRGGYRGTEKQSIEALNWLKWMSHKHSIRIQHARNGKERRIGRFKVCMQFYDVLTENCTVFGFYRLMDSHQKKHATSFMAVHFTDALTATRKEVPKFHSGIFHMLKIIRGRWIRRTTSESRGST